MKERRVLADRKREADDACGNHQLYMGSATTSDDSNDREHGRRQTEVAILLPEDSREREAVVARVTEEIGEEERGEGKGRDGVLRRVGKAEAAFAIGELGELTRRQELHGRNERTEQKGQGERRQGVAREIAERDFAPQLPSSREKIGSEEEPSVVADLRMTGEELERPYDSERERRPS